MNRSTYLASALMVAALYVEAGGPYYGAPGVDPWDEARDARRYPGPHPVVAHPPCKRWSLMGQCRGLRDGADAGCFEAALAAVNTWGGVLEHPAHTLAWKRYGIARPAGAGWTRTLFEDGVWTCEVDQRWYGHEARKPTWLLYVGPDEPPQLRWGLGPRGDQTVRAMGRAPGGDRSSLRSRTPAPFRDLLIGMARSCYGVEVAA